MPVAAFRCDASVQIGTGHVMRCLTLAAALRADGWHCHFLCRTLPGHLLARIAQAGFTAHALPPPAPGFVAPAAPAHAAWAGVPWAQDAAETRAVLAPLRPDWLVMDHYAFDAAWQQAARPEGARLMVWDDLADRPHACDLLLDQNAGRSAAAYDGLLPDACRRLIGPDHAVLRPEFVAARPAALAARARRPLRHLLIAMGGVDAPDVTGTCLETLATVPLPDGFHIAVALGAAAPALPRLRTRAAAMPVPTAVHVDAPDMARLMAAADLSIGGAGGTAWERCALGLPALVVVMADNQAPAAAALTGSGAALGIGTAGAPDLAPRLAAALAALADPERLHAMALAAARLVDGRGTDRVCAALRPLASPHAQA